MENIDEFRRVVGDFKKLKLNLRSENPTFLEIAQRSRRENLWSNILAFYLDPNKSHKLGPLLLESIFQSIKVEAPFNDLKTISVTREYPTDKNNRIYLVVVGDSFVVGIENKVDAELDNDLGNYSDTIDTLAKGKKAYKILLSKYPKPVTDGFINLLYSDLLKVTKQNIGEHTSFADTKYLIFLLDFLKNIENNTNSNIMNDNPELIKFIANNYDTIKAIVEVYNAHLNRPNEIRRLLNIKSGIPVDANKDKGYPYLLYKLDPNTPSDEFEVDFDETGILTYYTTENPQLQGRFNDEYSYVSPDEDIANGLNSQIDKILAALKQK
jgi:hypothetical protein